MDENDRKQPLDVNESPHKLAELTQFIDKIKESQQTNDIQKAIEQTMSLRDNCRPLDSNQVGSPHSNLANNPRYSKQESLIYGSLVKAISSERAEAEAAVKVINNEELNEMSWEKSMELEMANPDTLKQVKQSKEEMVKYHNLFLDLKPMDKKTKDG